MLRTENKEQRQRVGDLEKDIRQVCVHHRNQTHTRPNSIRVEVTNILCNTYGQTHGTVVLAKGTLSRARCPTVNIPFHEYQKHVYPRVGLSFVQHTYKESQMAIEIGLVVWTSEQARQALDKKQLQDERRKDCTQDLQRKNEQLSRVYITFDHCSC